MKSHGASPQRSCCPGISSAEPMPTFTVSAGNWLLCGSLGSWFGTVSWCLFGEPDVISWDFFLNATFYGCCNIMYYWLVQKWECSKTFFSRMPSKPPREKQKKSAEDVCFLCSVFFISMQMSIFIDFTCLNKRGRLYAELLWWVLYHQMAWDQGLVLFGRLALGSTRSCTQWRSNWMKSCAHIPLALTAFYC